MTPYCSRHRLNRILSRSLLAGVLSTFGLLTGLVPTLSHRAPGIVFDAAAYAQAVRVDELTKYAKSVLDIEPLRQQAYNDIKKLLGDDTVPPIDCSDLDSLSAKKDVRAIAVNFCQKSKTLVEQNDLTIKRFNEITMARGSDPLLEQRVSEEINRIIAARAGSK